MHPLAATLRIFLERICRYSLVLGVIFAEDAIYTYILKYYFDRGVYIHVGSSHFMILVKPHLYFQLSDFADAIEIAWVGNNRYSLWSKNYHFPRTGPGSTLALLSSLPVLRRWL